MTTNLNVFSRAAVLTVRGILTAVLLVAWTERAMAQTPPAAPATPPGTTTGTIEIGAGGITDGSYKAGEFNGLAGKGALALGQFDLRGGGSYDSDKALRWRVKGTELGLETRGLRAEIGEQGRYRLNFGYSELRRNRSDSYQTPYLGTGTNTLTLPSTWLVPVVASSSGTNNRTTSTSARGLVTSIGGASYIDVQTTSATVGTLLSPNATQLALVNAAAAADLPLFHSVNLHTKRRTYDVGFTASPTPAWGVDASLRAEHKDGMKPMGTVSRNIGGDISTIIPDLIDSNTAQVSTNISYKGDRSSVQGGYYGSFFTNQVASMSWQNWASGPGGTATVNTMGSAPGNLFHQFNMEGRHNLSKSTRLVASGSFGRNTQNATFLTLPSTPVVPVTSLDGLVVSKAFNARLTSRFGKAVNLTAAYRFDERENRTTIHIFQYSDAEEALAVSANFPASAGNPLGAVLAQNANANRPYSKKANRAMFDADYHLAKSQWVRVGYDFERINRWCTGSWIDCADAGVTNEHTVRAGWRANVGTAVNARVDYWRGQRRTPAYNENGFLALVPYAGVSPASATGGMTALEFMRAAGWNGWGPAQGFLATTGNANLFFPSNNALANAMYANLNRISELPGMRRYYVSDRDRNKVRTALGWRVTDALSLDAGLDLIADDYTDAIYGVQTARTWSANLDGTYEVANGVSASGFYTFGNRGALTAGNTYTANSNTANLNGFTALSGNSCDGFTTLQQRNNNNKLDPCLGWSADLRDKVHTFGFSLARKTETLDLTSDLTFSRARSANGMTGGNWANNLLALPGAPANTVAAYYIAATSLPDVTTNSAELRLNGKYTLRANQSLRVLYSYLRMRSVDWSYDGMQLGSATLSGVLPTNEAAFNFGVHVVGISYVIDF